MRSKNPEYFRLIERFVDDYREARGVCPTVREIHSGVGLSIGTISRYLSHMRENGGTACFYEAIKWGKLIKE